MLNVLVVGPDSLSGELMPSVLARPDVERIHVEQPIAAVEAAERGRVRLVLVDLPAVEAVSLLDTLRSRPGTRPCAVVWLDRGRDAGGAQRLRSAGATEVIPLPFDPVRWDRRLEELLAMPARVAEEIPARVLDGVQLLHGADESPATVLNLGARGVLLEGSRELAVGCKVGLSFALPGDTRPLAVVGHVVRREATGNGLHRAGIEFLAYRGDARERIVGHVGAQPAPARPGAADGGIPGVLRPFEHSREWEEELRSSEVRKSLMLDSSPASIVTVDAQGRVVEWNAAARRLFGFSRAEVLGRDAAELVVPPAERARFRRLLRELEDEGELPDCASAYHSTALRADGSPIPVELCIVPGYVRGHLLVTAHVRDISVRVRQEKLVAARHRAIRALTSSRSLAEAAPVVLNALVEGLDCDAVRLWLLEGQPDRLQLAAAAPTPAVAAEEAEDALARRALEVTAPAWEAAAPGRAGAAIAVPMRVAGESLGALEAHSRHLQRISEEWTELLSDVASEVGLFLERQRAEAELQRLARYDALTGLPNRAFFLETLQRTIARSARQGGRLAVVFVDLDGFKSVNDGLGHAAGDLVLRAMADRLREGTRSVDVVARIGGDEFVVLLQGLSRPDDAAGVARALVERVAAPVALEKRRLRLGASAGIAVYPEDGEDAETLLRHADLAMYRAKREGRNTWRFFTAEMSARVLERQRLLESLRGALERHEIEILYQPVLDGTRTTALEALVRWQHPRLGALQPQPLLAEAEESEFVLELGAAVLRLASRFAASCAGEVRLVVNLSPRQLRDTHLFETVRQALDTSGLPAGRLELDLPGPALVAADEETLARLHRLGELGVRLALDGFGRGAFSVERVRGLGVRALKIEPGLVASIPGSAEAVLQTDALLAAARVLGLELVATGIATEEQRAFFEERGVTSRQGPLFGPALAPSEAAALLAPPPLARD